MLPAAFVPAVVVPLAAGVVAAAAVASVIAVRPVVAVAPVALVVAEAAAVAADKAVADRVAVVDTPVADILAADKLPAAGVAPDTAAGTSWAAPALAVGDTSWAWAAGIAAGIRQAWAEVVVAVAEASGAASVWGAPVSAWVSFWLFAGRSIPQPVPGFL